MIKFFHHNQVPAQFHRDLGNANAIISANQVLLYANFPYRDSRKLGILRNWITEHCPDAHHIARDWTETLIIIPLDQAALLRLHLDL